MEETPRKRKRKIRQLGVLDKKTGDAWVSDSEVAQRFYDDCIRGELNINELPNVARITDKRIDTHSVIIAVPGTVGFHLRGDLHFVDYGTVVREETSRRAPRYKQENFLAADAKTGKQVFFAMSRQDLAEKIIAHREGKGTALKIHPLRKDGVLPLSSLKELQCI